MTFQLPGNAYDVLRDLAQAVIDENARSADVEAGPSWDLVVKAQEALKFIERAGPLPREEQT